MKTKKLRSPVADHRGLNFKPLEPIDIWKGKDRATVLREPR